MKIRPCGVHDFVSIKRLLIEFHEEALKEYGLECEEGLMEKAIKDNYANALVLLAGEEVVGVIAGKLVDYPLQSKQLFQELIWYVSKEYRGHGLELLAELEKKCKEMGINMIIMSAMGSSIADKMERIYKLMGYNEYERHYIKVLT